MKKRYVALLLCTFILSSAVLGVGYAALTDQLSVQGTVSAKPGAYVYISDAVVKSGTITDVAKSGTVLSSTVTLTNSSSAQAVIHVTVKNNTEYTYVFNGVTYNLGDTYDNTAIAVTTSIAKGAELASGAQTEFDVIFKYKSGVSTNKVLHSVLNLSYVPSDEYIPEIAVKEAIGRFGEILNEESSYDVLIDAMNDTSLTGRLSNSYIGNVVGASDADSAAVEKLFTVDGKNLLTLDIGGKSTNVTAMIKREDIGGDSKEEMVIYMTGEEITGNTFRPTYPQVFAVIYEQDETGAWVQRGQMYEGTAKSNPYFVGITHNSFNTSTWTTAQAYHGVAKGSDIAALYAAIPNE